VRSVFCRSGPSFLSIRLRRKQFVVAVVAVVPTASPSTRIIGLAGNLTFGNVTVGQSANATLTITNSGNGPLTITGLTVPSGSGTSYAASFTSGTIGAGASQPVTIQFKPASAGTYSGTLTVNGDQTSGPNTMPISGTGVSADPTPSPSAFSINGSVTDGTSHGVLPNITVQIGSGTNAGKSALTDGGGNYTIGSLAAGTFAVSAAATGYQTTTQQVFLTGNSRVDLVLQRVGAPSPTPPPASGPAPSPTPPPASGPIAAPGLPSRTSGNICSLNDIVHPASCINNKFGNATFICEDGVRSCSGTSQGACSSHIRIYCTVQ